MDTEHKTDSEQKTDSASSGRSSSCDKSLYDENSEFSLTDPSSDCISEAISETISPLRGGCNSVENIEDVNNCSTAIPDVQPTSVEEPDEALEGATSNAGATNNPDYNTWDIVGDAKDMLLLNQPDVTLSAANSAIVVDGCQAGPSKTKNSANSPSDYLTKMIEFKNRKVPIITQNVNGPCPLIAILNVLSLRTIIHLPTNSDVITSEKLMEYLGDCIFSSYPPNDVSHGQHNYEQNVHDAIAVLPKLQTGLDVNIRFSGVRDFEYTPECIVFDLLNIPLYHGWLVEHESPEIVRIISSCSYNQLVEKIIENQSSTDPDLSYQAYAADRFLKMTASQLTYQGLCELNSTIKEDELAVLFRNNHFITVYKHQNELFQLVTDQGFLSETGVVWETLSNIEGDSQFVDGKFVVVPPLPDPTLTNDVSTAQQVDQDYMVALTLQEEQKKQEDNNKSWNEYKHNTLGVPEHITDEELALRLQEEENAAANDRNTQRRGLNGNRRPQQVNKNKRNDCVIL